MDLTIEDYSLFSSNRLENLLNWEELESSIGMRVCKMELWNVDHQWNFARTWLSIVDFQPVGNDVLRKQALRRWWGISKICRNKN